MQKTDQSLFIMVKCLREKGGTLFSKMQVFNSDSIISW